MFQLNFLNKLRLVTRRRSVKRARPSFQQPVLLRSIWNELSQAYFPDKPELAQYQIRWSRRRQKRVLGSCNLNRRLVSIAQELNHPDYLHLLPPLIYHEMCHAAIGFEVEKSNGKRMWHGALFKTLERRHPQIVDLKMWMRAGGFTRAVRSHRTRAFHQRTRSAPSTLQP